MMSRHLKDESISKLLEDISTPESSSSENDPFCDDGEYGSDEDFEPNFNELSSDSDTSRKKKWRCINSSKFSTNQNRIEQSDTELEDETSENDAALPEVNIPTDDTGLKLEKHNLDHNRYLFDQTNITPESLFSNKQQIAALEVHRSDHDELNENTTLTHCLEQSVRFKIPSIESDAAEIFVDPPQEMTEPQLSPEKENGASITDSTRGIIIDNIWHDTIEPVPIFDFDYSSTGLRVSIEDSQPKELDIFKLLFSEHLLEYLVTQTNAYGLNPTYIERPQTRHSRRQTFREVEKEEMLAFLGLCLLLGQCNIPMKRSLFSYSNALYYHPFFSYSMSQRRFEQILRCLYVGEIGARREKKIIDFIDALCNNFRNVYGPDKQLSLDESLILFRGRLDFRQYIKNKKARYGIKFYELTSSDGYVLNIIMYTGKVENAEDTTTKKTEKIVMKLLNPYLMKGHHVYMDNFYNDVELSQRLLGLRTHTCGTLRRNRVSNPKIVTNTKLKKDDYIWRRKGNVYVSAWKDKRPVYMISTNNQPKMEWTANRFGKFSKKPKEVADYNQYMGGIDRKDQMVSYYSSPQKTIRWYKKVFFHMLDVCVWNAYHVHKKYFIPDKRYEFVDYRDALIRQMTRVDQKLSGRDVVRTGSIYSSRRTNTVAPPETSINNSGAHWPELIPCPSDTKRKFKFLNCKLCTKNKIRRETRYRCKGCATSTPLCPTCFEGWHDENKEN